LATLMGYLLNNCLIVLVTVSGLRFPVYFG